MSDKSSTSSAGIGLSGALFLLFLGLRLTDHIDWSWYWVAAPLWMPLGLLVGIIAIVVGIGAMLGGIAQWRRNRRLRRAKRAMAGR